jgi:hypothetical protein
MESPLITALMADDSYHGPRFMVGVFVLKNSCRADLGEFFYVQQFPSVETAATPESLSEHSPDRLVSVLQQVSH